MKKKTAPKKIAPKKIKAARQGIQVAASTGPFAEDKDVARDIRTAQIVPALNSGQTVVLDFGEVHLSTQSFIHALLSEVIRDEGADALNRIKFKDCNPLIKSLIRTVAEYSQETDAHRK